MNNNPRRKKITGQAKPVEKKGEGLNTGPVGKSDAYAERKEQQAQRENAQRPQQEFKSQGTPLQSTQNTQGEGGNVKRGIGKSPIIIIIIVIAAVFLISRFGCGNGCSLGNILNVDLSGLTDTDTPVDTTPINNTVDTSSQVTDVGSLLSGLFGGYSSAIGNTSSVSTGGWVTSANTGKLNTSVAPAARDKYTKIYNNRNDRVTIMVYMCGTDLESQSGMATADLSEMASATLSDNIDIIVYTGGCKQWKNNVVSNQYNQIFRIEGNGKLRTLVDNDGSESMTKGTTLTRFINYCTQNYPSNRNILIFWDHGGGSISGYGYDEKYKSSGSMSLAAINTALKNANTKFDFIGCDACLMATLENGLMLEKYADYMIASEETEPGVGWYYTNWLTSLAANPSMSTLEIGKNIADDFVTVCNQQCRGQDTTLSVVDLAELGATVPSKFSAFAKDTASMIKNNEYKTVSDARANTREFAADTKIDQIDLVHMAYNLNTEESKALASTLLNAVKYNRTSSSITNAYGLAIYFPYKKTSNVNTAVKAYESLGMDSDYTQCLKSFASVEVSGQAVAGGTSSPISSLLGSYSGQSTASSGDVSDLLGSLLGGDFSGLFGLSSGNTSSFFGKGIDLTSMTSYLTDNQLDASKLVWTKSGGQYVMRLTEQQWRMVHDVQLNVFYDDGEGFIDFGLDNTYTFTNDGALVAEYDGTWLAIDNQVVPYYFVSQSVDGNAWSVTGRIPVLLNGERAELIIVFDNETPDGYIAGARTVYQDEDIQVLAKNQPELLEGDRIEFICDYYSYDGEYLNSYILGDPITYTGDNEISYVYVDADSCTATYLINDIYNAEFWTEAFPK